MIKGGGGDLGSSSLSPAKTNLMEVGGKIEQERMKDGRDFLLKLWMVQCYFGRGFEITFRLNF